MIHSDVTSAIIGASIEVHRVLGPGLIESIYDECLCHELELRRVAFERQVPIPVAYKEVELKRPWRADLIVCGKVVVELKAVDQLCRIHESQLLTYLRLTGMSVGLMINFNVPVLTEGILRRVLSDRSQR